jgi:inner membrane protein involved in colicin E2 resistance
MPEAPLAAPPPLPKSQPSFGKRHSTIIKLLGVGALVLILLIPLLMITGVLTDRLQRRNEAVADITSSWGKEQSVIGPVLGIPYQYKFKAVKEMPAPDGKMERREVEETAITNAYFLPETLNVSGDAQTQMLHRGIYAAAVFRAQMAIRAHRTLGRQKRTAKCRIRPGRFQGRLVLDAERREVNSLAPVEIEWN